MRGKWAITAATAVILAASASFSGAFAQPASEADAPADATSRVRLTAGTDVVASLSPAGDSDWYRVAVRPGRMYQFTLRSEGEEGGVDDPLLVLHDSSGAEVSRNDDYGGELNSRVDYVASTRGTVFIEARGFGDDATGNYRLALHEEAAPSDDVGGDVHTRTRLSLGTPADGSLQFAGDRDWYKIHLDANQSYRFRLNSRGEGDAALGDPMMRLIGPGGEELVSDDDGGGSLNSYIEYTPTTAGDYFIEARGFADDAVGDYTVSAQQGDIPGDATTDMSLSADGDYHDGVLSPAGDKDWYKIELTEGQTVRVSLDSGEEGIGDPLLVIYNSESTEVARNDDSGGTLNSRIEFTAPAAGTYYIEARGFSDDAEGSYQLGVTAGEIGNTTDTSDSITVGSPVSSQIGVAGDADWYSIELVEGRPYRIMLNSDDDNNTLDPYLTLYNSEGEAVVTDDDGGAGVNSYLSYASVTGGTYYVGVSSFGDTGTGPYTLTVNDTEVPGNTSTDEALTAESGDDRVSSIDLPGDLDYFRADLSVGVRYVITVSGDGDHPLSDPFLTVRAEDGTELVTDDDSGPGLDARIVFAPTSSGSYYIQVSGLGGSTGQYKVAIAPNNQ